VTKQVRTTVKMADHGNTFYVPGCVGDVKCRDGLVSVFRKARKANNAFQSNNASHDMVSCLQYIRFHLPHKQSTERVRRMMANDLQILSTTDKHVIWSKLPLVQ